MSTCTIKVAPKNVTINEFTLKINGIVAPGNTQDTTLINQTYSNDTISINLNNYTYFLVTVSIQQYAQNGNIVNVPSNNKIELVSVVKNDCSSLILNEAQTIACAYAFHQFIDFDSSSNSFSIYGTNRQMSLALGMKYNFMLDDGTVSEVIKSSPNGYETNSFALWYSLSNILNGSIINSNTFQSFITDTETVTRSFFGALYALVENPFINAQSIYSLSTNQPTAYQPALHELNLPEGTSPAPTNWTLTIKVHKTGAENFLIAGPAFIAFDKNDRGWLTNNVMQGTPNSSTFCTVLEPNGKPTDFSPISGGGLLGAGFGVTIAPEGDEVYFGNFGWGPTQCNPHFGSISKFSITGEALSPTNGYVKGLSRVQGLNFDGAGNLWVTSWGSQSPFAPAQTIYPYEGEESAVVVYLKNQNTGDLDFDHPLIYKLGNPYRATFDVALNKTNGCMYLSCAGSENKKEPKKSGISGVYKFSLQNGQIHLDNQWDANPNNNPKSTQVEAFEGLKQVNFDSDGNVYVGAIRTGHSRIVKLTQDLNYITEFTDKINRPWSVTIAEDDTIFAGNFGPELEETSTHKQLPLGSTGVTIIKKNDNGTYASQLMTLPTGGDEVMLANGFPLYGVVAQYDNKHNRIHGAVPVQIPCYSPLMRITSSTIDGAGNLWVINNWKPSAGIDLLENPGGDGVVIFVGIAKPTPYQFG